MYINKETTELHKICFSVFLFLGAFMVYCPFVTYARTNQHEDINYSLCKKLKTKPAVQISLFFGLYRPDGNLITSPEWDGFVDAEVTSRFPNGLSIISVDGQWQDRITGHVGKEPSRLILISTEVTPDLSDRIEKIRTFYRKKFQQQAVGLLISSECESF